MLVAMLIGGLLRELYYLASIGCEQMNRFFQRRLLAKLKTVDADAIKIEEGLEVMLKGIEFLQALRQHLFELV